MVTITDYKELERTDGTKFCLLQVQGGVEFVRSKQTGDFYMTAKKAYVSSTFDKDTCEGLKGTQLQGEVKKEECAPFEYTVKDTGEIITLSHKWVYVPESKGDNEEKPHSLQEGFPKNEPFKVPYA